MNMILDNLFLMVVVVAIITCIVFFVIKFFRLSKKEQLLKVKEWLLYAVIESERELGSGTGRLKLRLVFDWFMTTFPFFSKIITFGQFSDLVDDALKEMKKLLETNENVAKYVNGKGDDYDIQKETD